MIASRKHAAAAFHPVRHDLHLRRFERELRNVGVGGDAVVAVVLARLVGEEPHLIVVVDVEPRRGKPEVADLELAIAALGGGEAAVVLRHVDRKLHVRRERRFDRLEHDP